MKLTIESTVQMVYADKNDTRPVGRVWVGTTDTGIAVQVLVSRVAVSKDADQTQFAKELNAQHAPAVAYPAFPLRMML